LNKLDLAFASLVLATTSAAVFAAGGTPADQAFVAKVSQGGMYEVQASKVATTKGSTQDVRDFAEAEVHDHKLVGEKLGQITKAQGMDFPTKLNGEFSAKLDHLKSLSGGAFDQAYMSDMATIHDADGAAFAAEATGGGSDAFKSFAAETHVIVLRHIGAIHAAPPPAK
jgi:putative membrane protein